MTVNPSDVVIWSADVSVPLLLDKLNGSARQAGLRNVKLDRLLLGRTGYDLIGVVQDLGYNVFADAKIIEIPDKAVALVEDHLKYRPWMLNCMADIWSTGFMDHANPKKVDALKRFADACHNVGTKPCAVTVLTSTSEDVARAKFNGRNAIEQVLVFTGVLLEAGFTDVVCSPQEVRAIRAESRFDSLLLNTPGIRLADTSNDDQARVSTPSGAIANGSDRLVIGRNLTQGDFAENYAAIAADLAVL